MSKKKRLFGILLALPPLLLGLLYGGGYIAQFMRNYHEWEAAGGTPGNGTSPTVPSFAVSECLRAIFTMPYGIVGILICVGALVLLIVMVMRMGYSETGEYDKDRNFIYSKKGTYGTSGFMSEKEAEEIFDLRTSLKNHNGTIFGLLNGRYVCMPEESMLNKNVAVYGASGSMKTRAYCINRILQATVPNKDGKMESLIICDPKSELYEKTSELLRKTHTVKVFNLVCPENSDSWNCLAEIEGDELMAQRFCDVIIKNTGSERGDHFWDSAEMNLLKALVLYVEQGYPPERKNIGQVYRLLTHCDEKELNSLFNMLPSSHPAKAPYAIFQQASDTVRSGVIIGLGSRLQVFQNKSICNMTAFDEIDMELPGQQPCAYFCITSDQDSTFDFLSSLFLSFVFIKLVRYADKNCEGGKLPIPVHVLGEELTACGVIPDLSRKISVIRSRNISMSCVFQNLAGLQNRYPLNQWQEILGNSDVQLFLGCVDELTAKYISDRSGEVSVHVQSKAKQLGTWRISNYTPEYRETSGVGKRKLLTMDEVLRLPISKALIIIRGRKLLQVDKCDYTEHSESKKMISCKASAHIPEWQKQQPKEVEEVSPAPIKKPGRKKKNAGIQCGADRQRQYHVQKLKEEQPMPKKKEEPEVAAAVETTESAAEVTDIEPVPVEPAAEVSAEPIEPAAEEPPKPKRTRKKKTDAVDEEALPEPQPAAPKETAAKKKETAAADRQNKPKADPILTLEVGGEVTTETHEMDAAWHEILTSNRSHRILTGMLGGVEETEAGKTLAVVDYKGFRVVIPLKEMLVKLEKNLKGTEYTEMIRRQNKLLSNMLGCEIDFIVKGVDQKTRTVVASRKEAMLKKRQVFYMNQDTSGAYRIYEGRTVQARVIAVAEKAVRIEAFGVECSIMARDLSWDWIGDANDRFSVGDQILVRILEVNRDSLEELSIRADVKSVSENTNRTYLKQCRVQSKYAGKVTDVHKGVVYVRLNNGANAIAHTCLDRRTPGKKDDVSFAVTHIDEDRGVAVGIITRIIKQHL